jgi:hypothetical protein
MHADELLHGTLAPSLRQPFARAPDFAQYVPNDPERLVRVNTIDSGGDTLPLLPFPSLAPIAA